MASTDDVAIEEARTDVMRRQVNDVRDVMAANVERVLQRGDQLEDLGERTNDLEANVGF